VEIFMGLKEGNLDKMIEHGVFTSSTSAAKALLEQMLRALDYLAYNGIIHRDIKPANILYTSLPEGQFHFQLAEFGLCNVLGNSRTIVGSPPYVAPEIMLHQGIEQTLKVDVWSLFVTWAYSRNVDGYQQKLRLLDTPGQQIQAAQDAAKALPKLAEMAVIEPENRASAAQMLIKLFDGMGLSTPREEVRPRDEASTATPIVAVEAQHDGPMDFTVP
jgi:serine/threonine protein kinase